MQNISRHRFLGSSTAATLALAGAGVSGTAVHAQTPLSFRVSSGMAADQNAAHYLWFQRFSANLGTALPPGSASSIDGSLHPHAADNDVASTGAFYGRLLSTTCVASGVPTCSLQS